MQRKCVLIVTAYGRSEFNRLINLSVNVPYRILLGDLDDRLQIYDSEEKQRKAMCEGLMYQLPIHVSGEVGICCLYHKHNHNIGNVNNETLKQILSKQQVKDNQRMLLQGKTNYYICRRCTWEGI